MDIKIIKLNDLVPYSKNPRKNAGAVDAVANSIKEFGFKVPLVIDRNYEIAAGHTRYLAAKKLKITEVPCLVADDLTPEQIRAFRLADNKTHELSEWDFDLLGMELKDLNDFDMSVFGFDMNASAFDEVREDDFDVNGAIEEIQEPESKSGEIYLLGKHRLICGNATSENTATTLMNGAFADLVVTDPPYNMNYIGAGGSKRKGIANDKMPEHEFITFLTAAFKNYARSMRDGAAGYCFYKEMGGGVFLQALKTAELKFNQQCVWIKNIAVLGGSLYQGMHEPFLLFFKGSQKNKTWNGKRNQKSVLEDIDFMDREQLAKYIKRLMSDDFGIVNNVVRADKPLKSDLHPTMKPIKLMGKLIENSSNKEQIVLDMFGGSGSTLIACEQTNRACYMAELDPIYCDVIIKRWERFTGNRAAKAGEVNG